METMKALLCTRLGGPDDLEVADIPAPVAGPGEAVVAVRAAALNFFESSSPSIGCPGSRITAATYTSAAPAPRPASSQPHSIKIFSLDLVFTYKRIYKKNYMVN